MSTHERVRAIMTDQVTNVPPDMSLRQARELMLRGGFRHLPVVVDDRLVGILSDRDLLRVGAGEAGEKLTVAEAMAPTVLTCGLDDRLGDTVDRMLHAGIDALPVVDVDDHVLGILTSTDLLAALRRREGLTDVGAAVESRIAKVERNPD